MPDTPLAAAHKFERLAKDIGTLQKRTLNEMAITVKRNVTAAMAAAGAGTGKLRGVGRKGARIGVRYDQTAGGAVLVRATGPFHLLESDTKAHRIPLQRGARARKRVVVIPGVGVRSFVNHPGSKGKHPWAKGVEVSRLEAGKISQRILTETVTQVFR